MKVLDLCCGLGGFSAAFRDRGHTVIGVDITPPATIIADVRKLPFKKGWSPDVLLASPPCTEFSRESMPWSKTGKAPDMSIVEACFRAVDELKPKLWCIENVRGAVKWFPTRPTTHIGSRYLWTNIPMLGMEHEKAYGKWKLPPSPDRARLRSLIPYCISERICDIAEACL